MMNVILKPMTINQKDHFPRVSESILPLIFGNQ